MALLKDNNNTVKADEGTSTKRVQYISEDVSSIYFVSDTLFRSEDLNWIKKKKKKKTSTSSVFP